MKQKRQQLILKIIESQKIFSQEGILEALMELGVKATQSTVSRDIKELELIKSTNDDGYYMYSRRQTLVSKTVKNKGNVVFYETLVSVDNAQNIVCVRCHAGMASAAAAAIDVLEHRDIVGTIAGDDTIFVLFRTEQQAIDFTIQCKNGGLFSAI